MRVATFNVQNLRLRRDGGGLRLDGAWDKDADEESSAGDSRAIEAADRRLTAGVIAHANADILALQEVFDQATLDYFHDAHLAPLGAVYPFRYCLEGNDGRSSDVAVMSRRPLAPVVSHARLSFADLGVAAPPGVVPSSPVFRRDCLGVRCGSLWLFICHLKAQTPHGASAIVRRAEALGVRRIIERSIEDPWRTSWLALGDFNAHDADGEADLVPLTHDFAIDLGAGGGDGWSYYEAQTGRRSRPDRIFAGFGLVASAPNAASEVVRIGMGRCAGGGERLPDVGDVRPHASDHALVFADI